MKTNKYLIIILIAFSNSFSQKIQNSFTNFTEVDGLPSNTVTSIIQDHLGYLWIGTLNGLSRYDGYEFLNFSPVNNDTNFLQLSLTQSLFEDRNGDIWIGSVQGLTKYIRAEESFKLFSLEEFSIGEKRGLAAVDIIETNNGEILFTVADWQNNFIKKGLYFINSINNEAEQIAIANEDSPMLYIKLIS